MKHDYHKTGYGWGEPPDGDDESDNGREGWPECECCYRLVPAVNRYDLCDDCESEPHGPQTRDARREDLAEMREEMRRDGTL